MSSIREVCVVGSCLVRVFRSELKPPKLCVGGRQIRIRHGLPNPPGGLEDLVHTDMDDNLAIPGVTVCIRLLPASKVMEKSILSDKNLEFENIPILNLISQS